MNPKKRKVPGKKELRKLFANSILLKLSNKSIQILFNLNNPNLNVAPCRRDFPTFQRDGHHAHLILTDGRIRKWRDEPNFEPRVNLIDPSFFIFNDFVRGREIFVNRESICHQNKYVIIPEKEFPCDDRKTFINALDKGLKINDMRELYDEYSKTKLNKNPTIECKLKSDLLDWVYDTLFQKISDRLKRQLEAKSIKATNFDFYFKLSPKVEKLVPYDVIRIILDYLPRNKALLDNLGCVSEQWYLSCLQNWKILRVNDTLVRKIPILAYQSIKALYVNVSCRLLGRHGAYIGGLAKNVEKICLFKCPPFKFLKALGREVGVYEKLTSIKVFSYLAYNATDNMNILKQITTKCLNLVEFSVDWKTFNFIPMSDLSTVLSTLFQRLRSIGFINSGNVKEDLPQYKKKNVDTKILKMVKEYPNIKRLAFLKSFVKAVPLMNWKVRGVITGWGTEMIFDELVFDDSSPFDSFSNSLNFNNVSAPTVIPAKKLVLIVDEKDFSSIFSKNVYIAKRKFEKVECLKLIIAQMYCLKRDKINEHLHRAVKVLKKGTTLEYVLLENYDPHEDLLLMFKSVFEDLKKRGLCSPRSSVSECSESLSNYVLGNM